MTIRFGFLLAAIFVVNVFADPYAQEYRGVIGRSSDTPRTANPTQFNYGYDRSAGSGRSVSYGAPAESAGYGGYGVSARVSGSGGHGGVESGGLGSFDGYGGFGRYSRSEHNEHYGSSGQSGDRLTSAPQYDHFH